MPLEGRVQADVLVVGSGASAVNAASPLVAGGLRVRMLDFGNRDEVYESLVPAAPFSTIRRTDPNQHRYFLGDRYEGLALGRVSIGAQLTPPRQLNLITLLPQLVPQLYHPHPTGKRRFEHRNWVASPGHLRVEDKVDSAHPLRQ